VAERQEILDEEILLQDQVFSVGGALRFEEGARRFRPLVPGRERPHDSLHVDDRPDSFRMSLRPVKAERGPPVVDDENHFLVERELLEPRVEIAPMIDEPVGAVRSRAGIAHADVVRRKAATERQQIRNDVAPEIGGCGVAVQKHDRITLADVDVGDVGIEHVDSLSVRCCFCRDHVAAHGCESSLASSRCRRRRSHTRKGDSPASTFPRRGESTALRTARDGRGMANDAKMPASRGGRRRPEAESGFVPEGELG